MGQKLPDQPQPNSFLHKLNQLFKEKWPEYVIEILVIILSITISLAVDEWKDTQRKRETEQAYLKGILNDVTTDLEELQEVITETQEVIRTTQKLLNAGKPGQAKQEATFIRDVKFMMKRPRFVSEDATFADLNSTGNMQLLTSTDLKRALFNYYNRYKSTVLVENAELTTATGIVGPYLLNSFSLIDEQINPANVAALTRTPAFRNIVFVRNTNRQELLMNYQDLRKQAAFIQQLVKKQIND